MEQHRLSLISLKAHPYSCVRIINPKLEDNNSVIDSYHKLSSWQCFLFHFMNYFDGRSCCVDAAVEDVRRQQQLK